MIKSVWERLLAGADGRIRILLAGLVALAATFTIVVSVDGGSDGKHPRITVTVHASNGKVVKVDRKSVV